MKTETKVDIADYLALYEFKKAYDRGEKIHAYSFIWESYWIPAEEMNERMEERIKEYELASQKWESNETLTQMLNDLESSRDDLRKELEDKMDLANKLAIEIEQKDKDLESAQHKAMLYLAIAMISSLITTLTLF